MTKPDKNHSLFLNTFDNKDKNIIKNETRLIRGFGLQKIEAEAEQSSDNGELNRVQGTGTTFRNFVPEESSGNQNYASEPSSVSLADVELGFTQDDFIAKQTEKHSTKKQNQKFLPEPSDTGKASKTNAVELLDERFRVLEEGWGYYSRKKKPLFYKIEIMRFE
jgi:hypothetical protein